MWSFINYILSSYYVPGPVLGTSDFSGDRNRRGPCPLKACVQVPIIPQAVFWGCTYEAPTPTMIKQPSGGCCNAIFYRNKETGSGRVKGFAWAHTATKWQSQDSDSKFVCLWHLSPSPPYQLSCEFHGAWHFEEWPQREGFLDPKGMNSNGFKSRWLEY